MVDWLQDLNLDMSMNMGAIHGAKIATTMSKISMKPPNIAALFLLNL